MINIFSLILLNTIFFVCNFYPKHIVGTNASFLAIVLNILFYLLFAYFLIVSVSRNKNFFSQNIIPLYKSKRIRDYVRIILVIAIRIAFDLITLSLTPVLNEKIIYFKDIVTVLLWIIVYLLCAPKNTNIFTKKKSVPAVLIFILLISVTTFLNHNILSEGSFVLSKYIVDSSAAETAIGNLDFLFELKNFFLDTLLGVTLIWTHQSLNKVDVPEEDNKSARLFIRFVLLILLAMFLMGVKMVILPSSCISKINARTDSEKSSSEERPYGSTYVTTLIMRLDENLKNKLVYTTTNHKISLKDDIIASYTSTNLPTDSIKQSGNTITIESLFEEFVYDDLKIYLYNNETACFVNNGDSVTVYCEDAISESNEALTSVYKCLIENNKWNFFEQATKYLLKYDRDFILPYIERFSSGKFEKDEIETLNELFIKQTYIQSLSSNLIK